MIQIIKKNYFMSFLFIDQDISHVEVRLYGVILGIPVPWPMKKPDACQDIDSGVKCPLQKDQESEYKTTMSIDKAFPPVIMLRILC